MCSTVNCYTDISRNLKQALETRWTSKTYLFIDYIMTSINATYFRFECIRTFSSHKFTSFATERSYRVPRICSTLQKQHHDSQKG
jgi:hypothetical protein